MKEIHKRIINIMVEHVKVSKTPMTLKELCILLPDVNPRNVRFASEGLCRMGRMRQGQKIKNNVCYILTSTQSYYEKYEEEENT